MKNDWPLFDLHIRMVRSRKAGRGIRLSAAEFQFLAEETDVLDQLWGAISRELKARGYSDRLLPFEKEVERANPFSDEAESPVRPKELVKQEPACVAKDEHGRNLSSAKIALREL